MKSSERLKQLEHLGVIIKDCKVPRKKIENMPVVVRFDDGIEYVGEGQGSTKSAGHGDRFFHASNHIINIENIKVPRGWYYNRGSSSITNEKHYLLQGNSELPKIFWLPSRHYLNYKLQILPKYSDLNSHGLTNPPFDTISINYLKNSNFKNVAEVLSAFEQFNPDYMDKVMSKNAKKNVIETLRKNYATYLGPSFENIFNRNI